MPRYVPELHNPCASPTVTKIYEIESSNSIACRLDDDDRSRDSMLIQCRLERQFYFRNSASESNGFRKNVFVHITMRDYPKSARNQLRNP